MRAFRSIIAAFSAAAMLAMSMLAITTPAQAQIAATAVQESVTSSAVVTATANYANSTTSATDIAGATVTVPRTLIPGQFYRVCYWADAGKATSTTGTIGLNVNGSAVTAAARQIASTAGRGTIAMCYVAARPTNSAFIVKLTGVSGDTAAFTVYNAQMSVQSFFVAS